MSTSRAARKENCGRGVAGSIRKPEIFCFCGEVLALTWLFFQIGGCCVACNSKIFVLLHFVWKLVISKTHKHKNQRIVSHIFAQMIVDVCLFSNKDVNQWKFCKSKEKVGTSKTWFSNSLRKIYFKGWSASNQLIGTTSIVVRLGSIRLRSNCSKHQHLFYSEKR